MGGGGSTSASSDAPLKVKLVLHSWSSRIKKVQNLDRKETKEDSDHKLHGLGLSKVREALRNEVGYATYIDLK